MKWAPVTIVSGSPGSGKSTLARLLADQDSVGVHLHTDDFFDYVAHKIDPSQPASATQNAVVLSAYLAAADAFVSGGYHVYLDGVIGPWWFDQIGKTFPKVELIFLHVDLDIALARTQKRAADTGVPAPEHMVREMNKQFAAIHEWGKQRIDVGQLTPQALLEEVVDRRARGMLDVTLAKADA